MADFPQTIAPLPDDAHAADLPAEAPEPAPITEQEVGQYREQDRFLPVRRARARASLSLSQANHDDDDGRR
jgi:hypothetical protein